MPRITIGATTQQETGAKEDQNFDFKQLAENGMTLLKFGRGGTPHERVVRITGDNQYIYWVSGWFSRKFGKKCVVDLEKVTRVMTGQKTYAFQRWSHRYGFAEDKSLSLIYNDDNGNEHSFDIVLATEEQYQFWIEGINFLIKKIKDRRSKMSIDELLLETQWKKADKDRSGTLTSGEVISLIASMNIHMPTKKIMEVFCEVDLDKSNALNFVEFVKLMNTLLIRIELIVVWKALTIKEPELSAEIIPFVISPEEELGESRQKSLNADQLVTFWEEYQKEPISKLGMISALCEASGISDPIIWESSPITFATFSKLLYHPSNDIFNPSKAVIYQDMSRPLTHYFIASSHNTYLEGDQLTSASSVNRYINDLLNSCRCVELDCWDGEKNDPIITHGNTLTGKIFFRDVIKAIEQYSFVTSKYPVILSIENHCNLEQQRVMATIMKDVFKDKLGWPGDYPSGFLPSPEQLAYKILIKGKRPSAPSARDQVDEEDDDDEEEEDDEEDDESARSTTKKTNKSNKGTSEYRSQTSVSDLSDSASVTSGDTSTTGKKEKKVKLKTHPDLAAITFLAAGKFPKGFTSDFENSPSCDTMSSYSETKTEKTLKDNAKVKAWMKHNQKHMSRIYPKGSRIDSSNYDPAYCWVAGNQLVALNYQTNALPLHVNHGRFRENGNCGYVERPEFMLRENPSLEPNPHTFYVHIISGQQLPKPRGAQSGEIIDPFVRVYIHGHPDDQADFKTKFIPNNGFNPIWNEVFEFKIKYPELAILTLEVYDEDVVRPEFIAFYSLPLGCVRPGIRYVPLSDNAGQREQDFTFASLLVRTDLKKESA